MRVLRSAAARTLDELVAHARLRTAPGKPRLALCPSHGPNMGSSRLRVYALAEPLAANGWNCLLLSPRLRESQRNRLLARFRPDLLLVQKSRHPLNRVDRLGTWPVVYDLDDADFLDPRLSDESETMARRALGVICGSAYIADWAGRLNPNAVVVWSGTPPGAGPWPAHRDRAPIVAWAQSEPLAYPTEFTEVREIALELLAAGTQFVLRLYGWKEDAEHASLAELRGAGCRIELIPPLPYDGFLASLREVAVGLSPLMETNPYSRGKSFGKILGYLDARVPVICSDAADHALFFTSHSGVVSNDRATWVSTIRAWLADPDLRERVAAAAHRDFLARLSTEAAAAAVHEFLDRTLGAGSNARVHSGVGMADTRRGLEHPLPRD